MPLRDFADNCKVATGIHKLEYRQVEYEDCLHHSAAFKKPQQSRCNSESVHYYTHTYAGSLLIKCTCLTKGKDQLKLIDSGDSPIQQFMNKSLSCNFLTLPLWNHEGFSPREEESSFKK